MLVYLDQNKWIELARCIHGKETDPSRRSAADGIVRAAASGEAKFPLSAVHYVELARVSNAARRERLGSVMYDISRGVTLASVRQTIEHEVEVSLSRLFPAVIPRPFALLGRGVRHAFGKLLDSVLDNPLPDRFERSMLAGDTETGLASPSFRDSAHRENFQRHLSELKHIRETLPRAQWEDALFAISMVDIVNPLNSVLEHHNLDKSTISTLSRQALKLLMLDMPTRRVDLHLHRQVLRNKNYVSKLNDLEDWAALGTGSAYCDVVVCEKHMADLLSRDNFATHARIATELSQALMGTQLRAPRRLHQQTEP